MSIWQERVLKKFSNRIPIFIVSDNEEILRDDALNDMMLEQRIETLDFKDPVIFRNTYEKEYKDKVLEKKTTLIIRVVDNQFNVIPYDVFKRAIQLTLTAKDIFPNVQSEVLRDIPRNLYPAIDSVHSHCLFASVNETVDFLLQELFLVNIRSFIDEKSIVKAALDYVANRKDPIPDLFLERLANVASNHSTLNNTRIKELFSSEKALYQFLNQRWKKLIEEIDSFKEKPAIAERQLSYSESLFKDIEIRNHLFKLFDSDILEVIKVKDSSKFEQWMQYGIEEDAGMKTEEIRSKLSILNQNYTEFQMKDWLSFSVDLAVLQNELQGSMAKIKEWDQKLNKVNGCFEEWMLSKYNQLHSLPPVPRPKMVHQIPHYLTRFSDKKIALLVLDGMNMSQWLIVKDVLTNHQLKVDETPVFSWIPSSTNVSRQSIFSGLKPYEFEDSIRTTNKENKQWREFWAENGIPENYVAYEKSLGLKKFNREDLIYSKNPSIKVYGAVIDVIDQFIHGARQGNETVYSEIRTWLQSDFLLNFITDLLNTGFEVFLTSDHGNKECNGIGRLNEGVLVESKGERMRTYSSKKLRDEAAKKYSDTIAWTDIGLPEDFYVLLAKGDGAFISKNNRIVTHGGISIEEVIVPFVKVSR